MTPAGPPKYTPPQRCAGRPTPVEDDADRKSKRGQPLAPMPCARRIRDQALLYVSWSDFYSLHVARPDPRKTPAQKREQKHVPPGPGSTPRADTPTSFLPAQEGLAILPQCVVLSCSPGLPTLGRETGCRIQTLALGAGDVPVTRRWGWVNPQSR